MWPAEVIVMLLPTGMIAVLNGTVDDGSRLAPNSAGNGAGAAPMNLMANQVLPIFGQPF